MGSACVLSRAQVGLAAPLVRVEVHVGGGLPQFSIVGLAAPVVRESKDRVRAALASGGFEFPAGRLTVNLAPAELPKEGGRFDLPIALGILIASQQLRPRTGLDAWEFFGELGLNGALKPVQGLLLAALQAGAAGHRVCAPAANAAELAHAGAGSVRVADLAAAVACVAGREVAGEAGGADTGPDVAAAAAPVLPDLADVRGQGHGKVALEIAAAGGHHLLFVGPPGAGKSMLAQRLPGLLPPLDAAAHREVMAIHSLLRGPGAGLPSARPPFRAPHHTASPHAIVGGGPRVSPGEISLAHHGVLFLDELPEFDRRVLEGLREPLETGVVSIARAGLRADYPARFQLVAAMNECPCGRLGAVRAGCDCTPRQRRGYRAKLSGPLLDRIDLQVSLQSAGVPLMPDATRAEPSAAVLPRVCAARERQLARQGCLNAHLPASEVLARCGLRRTTLRHLARLAEHHELSVRAAHRLACVARTIADLAGAPQVTETMLLQALSYRRALGEEPGDAASAHSRR